MNDMDRYELIGALSYNLRRAVKSLRPENPKANDAVVLEYRRHLKTQTITELRETYEMQQRQLQQQACPT